MAKEKGYVKTGAPILKQTLIVFGETVLDEGGGVKIINEIEVKATDMVIVSLKSDDTGTPITTLLGEAVEGGVKITRTDDVSSADDAVASYMVLRQAL